MNLFSAKRPTFSNVPEFLFYCILYIALYCTLTGLKIRETHGTQILILSVKSQYLYAYNLFWNVVSSQNYYKTKHSLLYYQHLC